MNSSLNNNNNHDDEMVTLTLNDSTVDHNQQQRASTIQNEDICDEEQKKILLNTNDNQRTLSIKNDDPFICMIRDILRTDSGLSSLNSSSSNPLTDEVSRTNSSVVSEFIQIENEETQKHDVYELTEFDAQNSRPTLASATKASSITMSFNITDYPRVLRYMEFVLVILVTLCISLATLKYLHFNIQSFKSLLYFLLFWASLIAFYFVIPTFKSWFYYWDPDFTLTKPSKQSKVQSKEKEEEEEENTSKE